MKDNPKNPIAVYLDRNNDGTRTKKTDLELLSEVTGRTVENLLGDLIPTEQALSALSLKSNQLQATVDELKQRCEELEKYVRHKDECLLNIADMNLAQDYDIVCSCNLDKLLTPNERK